MKHDYRPLAYVTLIVIGGLVLFWFIPTSPLVSSEKLFAFQLTALSILFSFMLSAYASKQLELRGWASYLLWGIVLALVVGSFVAFIDWAYLDPPRELATGSIIAALFFMFLLTVIWGAPAALREARPRKKRKRRWHAK